MKPIYFHPEVYPIEPYPLMFGWYRYFYPGFFGSC